MLIYSPLRYPGGKGFLYKFTAQIIDNNSLHEYCYAEPYAGGAGLALALLFTGKVKKIILNDIDPAIYSLWFSILNYTEELCQLIRKTDIDIKSYIEIKEKFNTTHNILELGFATLFLNRTNRSGILNGGPIGGYSQSGKYKLDCRFNKERLINLIRQIADVKDRIEIYNLNATDFLNKILAEKNNIFVFLDPPYYNNGNRLYTNFYKHKDHRDLADYILTGMKDVPWIMTYDLTDVIMELYSKYVPYILIDVVYSAGNIKRKQEVLFYNRIIVPSMAEGTQNTAY